MRHSFILKKNLIFLVIAVCYAQDNTNPVEIEKVFSNIAPDNNLVKAAYDSYNTKKFVTICWIETTTLHLSKTGGQNYGYVQFAISLELTPTPFTVIASDENASIEPYRLYDKYTKQDRVLNFKTVQETDEEEVKVNRTYICRSDKHYAKTVIKLPESDKVVVELNPENLELSSFNVPPSHTGSTRFLKEDSFKYTKEPRESDGTFSQVNINSKVPSGHGLEHLTLQKLLTPQQTSLNWETGDSHRSSLELGKAGSANSQESKTETGYTELGSKTWKAELASAEGTVTESGQTASGNKEVRTGESQETDTSKSKFFEEMKVASDELNSSSSELGDEVLKNENQSDTESGESESEISQEGESGSEEHQTETLQESTHEPGEFQIGSKIKLGGPLIGRTREEVQQAEVRPGESLIVSSYPVFAKSEESQIDSAQQGEITSGESQSDSSQSIYMRLGELQTEGDQRIGVGSQSKEDLDESQTENIYSNRMEWGELHYPNAQPNSVIEGELQSGGAQQIGTAPQSEDELHIARVHPTRMEWRELRPQSARPNIVIGREWQIGDAPQIGIEPQSEVDSYELQTERVHSNGMEWEGLQPQRIRPNLVIGREWQMGGAPQIGIRPQSEVDPDELQTERIHSTGMEWRELQPQSARPNVAIGSEWQIRGAPQIGIGAQTKIDPDELQTETVHSPRMEWRELQPQSARPNAGIRGEWQSGAGHPIGIGSQSGVDLDEFQPERVHSTGIEWEELQSQPNSAIKHDFTHDSKPIELGSLEFPNEDLQQILMGLDESRTVGIQHSGEVRFGDSKIGHSEETLAADNSFSTTLEDEILKSEASLPVDLGSGEMKMELFQNEEPSYPQYVPQIMASGEVITDSHSDGSDFGQLLKMLQPQKYIEKSSDSRYDGSLSFSRSYPYNFENKDSASVLGLAATRTPAPVAADLNPQGFYSMKIQEPNVPFRVLTDAPRGSVNQLQNQEQQYQFQPKVSECGSDGKVLVKMKMDILDKDGEIANMEKNIEVDLSSYDTDPNVADFDQQLASLIRDYYGDRLLRQCKKITNHVSSTRKLMNPYLRSYQDVLQDEDDAFYPTKEYFYSPSEELGKFYLGPDNRYYIAQHNSNIPAFEKASLFRKISAGIQNAFRFLTNN